MTQRYVWSVLLNCEFVGALLPLNSIFSLFSYAA